jgi:cell division protein FtsB
MKRVFALLALSVLAAGLPAGAQDSNTTAAGVAAKQAADERYERMAADLQALQADNQSLKAKIASLEQKIDDLLRQQGEAASRGNVQDDLKRLADKIVEVDLKREQDKQAISEQIRKSIADLEKSLAGAAATAHPPPKSQPDTEAPAAGNGVSYTIKEGDNLSVIVQAYNADFKSKGWKPITMKQAREANPKVEDWNHLRVGQKIIIPLPAQQ